MTWLTRCTAILRSIEIILCICIILGVSSFEWWNNHLELMCNGGDISGLRKGPASVFVRVHFPNNNSQLIFDPNNNTLAKSKLIYLFQEKKRFFHISCKIYRKYVCSNFVERVKLSYWPKVHEKEILIYWDTKLEEKTSRIDEKKVTLITTASNLFTLIATPSYFLTLITTQLVFYFYHDVQLYFNPNNNTKLLLGLKYSWTSW